MLNISAAATAIVVVLIFTAKVVLPRLAESHDRRQRWQAIAEWLDTTKGTHYE